MLALYICTTTHFTKLLTSALFIGPRHCSYIFAPCLAYQPLVEVLQRITDEGGAARFKISSWLVEKHVRFWSFLGLHACKEIFSAAEVLAAGLQRTNMTA